MLEESQLNESFLANLGSAIAPLFAPLGWGDWQASVAAITGLVAKENLSLIHIFPVRILAACKCGGREIPCNSSGLHNPFTDECTGAGSC